jgi:hypothetical protein
MKPNSVNHNSINSAPAPVAAIVVPMAHASSQREDHLLLRLNRAAELIRRETEQIQSKNFLDQSVRLLRLLGETVEEQRLGFEGRK